MGEVVCETLPLLDELARQMGCEYLSDLRFLDALARQALGCALKALPSRYASLREWNDALAYLTGEPPQSTADAARALLVERLTHPSADLPGQPRHSHRTV